MEKDRVFSIRGHHTVVGPFGYLEGLFLFGNPDTQAIRTYSRAYVKDAHKSWRGDYDSQYTYDVFGITNEDEETFIDRDTGVLESFAALPNDAVITLGCAPDSLCTACIFGVHCKKTTARESDNRHLLNFIDYAKFAGYDADIHYVHRVEADGLSHIEITKAVYLSVIECMNDCLVEV